MHRYIARRLVHLVPVLLITSFLVFAMLLLLPGDPTFALLGEQASQADRLLLRAKLGLDQPIPLQYLHWMGSTLSGDLGRSLRTQEPVIEMLTTRIPVTLELTLLAIGLSIVIGLPAGIVAALWRNSWLDVAASMVGMAGIAMPYFWMGILLIMLFSLTLGWLPPSGYVPFTVDPIANLKLMILPALTIGSAMAALVMRQTRTSMLQVLSQDYVRTARAKGASERRVVYRHALRNALLPVITGLGLSVLSTLSGSVAIELIFGRPGLGSMLVGAIETRDYPVIQAGIVVFSLFVVLVNLAMDIIYTLVDPRVGEVS